MRYEDLSIYSGSLNTCSNCGRKFSPGQVIVNADEGDLLFCNDNLCMQWYTVQIQPPRQIFGYPFIFKERLYSEKDRKHWWQLWRCVMEEQKEQDCSTKGFLVGTVALVFFGLLVYGVWLVLGIAVNCFDGFFRSVGFPY